MFDRSTSCLASIIDFQTAGNTSRVFINHIGKPLVNDRIVGKRTFLNLQFCSTLSFVLS